MNSPVSENPPSDGDEPHDDEGHGDDVVDEVTAELAAAARHVMATLPAPTDAAGALVHCDPQQEEEADTEAARYEEPGQVGFRWTIWVWLSIWIGLECSELLVITLVFSLLTSRAPMTAMQQSMGKPRM